MYVNSIRDSLNEIQKIFSTMYREFDRLSTTIILYYLNKATSEFVFFKKTLLLESIDIKYHHDILLHPVHDLIPQYDEISNKLVRLLAASENPQDPGELQKRFKQDAYMEVEKMHQYITRLSENLNYLINYKK